MNFRLILSVLFLFSFQLFNAQNLTAQKAEKIDTLFEQLYKNGQFNGTVLVAENGKILHKGAYGYGDYAAKRKLEIGSPCYLASVSKQFTTMAIMQLKEKGKLNYENKLGEYFPEIEYAKNVTIRQMMQHTSGVANHYSLGIYKPGLTNENVVEALLKQKELDFNPGDENRYSNGAYVLLSMIVAKISGQSFPVYMEENIFAPLNMDATLVYEKNTPEIKNRAIGYTPAWTLEDYEILTTGAGGMYSTVEDLLKWDQALYSEKLISQKSLEEAFTSAKLNDGSETDYGFGWGIDENNNGGKIVNHSGSLNGFRTFIERDLEKRWTIILLTNNGSSYLSSILNTLRNIKNGEEYGMPKINMEDYMHRLIGKVGVEKAMEIYEMKWRKNNGEYNMAEDQLNRLGYFYMGEKDFETAIAIFKRNAKSYPDSFNTYDSLAEAYMENSIFNYKKSLELNPGNENAKNMLEKMGAPIVPEEEIKIADEILESYLGKYEMVPEFSMIVFKEDGQMKTQATGQSAFDIFPQTETKFYLTAVTAQIEFNKNEDEVVESLTLFQNGREMVFKKTK